jgi:asparagine synthetase B (glutamine-hydrolysing)
MNISFLLELDTNRPYVGPASGLFTVKPDFVLHLTGSDYEFLAWGDPISSDRFTTGLHQNLNPEFIVNNLSGHYNYILADNNRREIMIGSSLFSILPVYYCVQNNRVTISGNVFDLGKHTGLKTVSASFVAESLLFNYPLHNSSLIEGISLLPSNSVLTAGADGLRISKHTAIETWFTNDPEPWRRSLSRMAETFLETSLKYFPKEHYAASLTGGFDGRTLVAAGLYNHRDFSCYCIGSGSSDDMLTAARVAEGSALKFTPVITDEKYVSEQSLDSGLRFISGSSGVATFSRAHYIFAASQLAAETRYIITGNFGSEIFRAVHNPGVMISPALYDVFVSRDPGEAMEKLTGNRMAGLLGEELLHSVRRVLRESIEALPCFDSNHSNLSRNQQFYIFVFEELFRKYFGSEIVNQAPYVTNRTPFLDPLFVRELLGTGLAGTHSEFFENNPFKRFKGQALYATIIRQAAPMLGRFPTVKGYSPDDLLSLPGNLRIAASRMRKKKRLSGAHADPLGVSAAWANNSNFYGALNVNGNIFDNKTITSLKGGLFTDEKARLFSLLYCIHLLNNQ